MSLDWNITPGTYGSIWEPCAVPTTTGCDVTNDYVGAWAAMQLMTYSAGDIVMGVDGLYYIATNDTHNSGGNNPDLLQWLPQGNGVYQGLGGGGNPWVLCTSTV